MFRQNRTIPALRLKHRSGSCGTASAGIRIPDTLIKRAHRAEHSDFRSFEFLLFLCKAS